MRRIRTIFLTGIILSLPTVVTLYVLWVGFHWVDGLVGSMLQAIVGHSVPGLGVATFVGLIFLAGLFGTNFLGRRLLDWFDQLMEKIPIIRSIYGTVRQILDSFVLGESTFREVVIIEYPRPGIYSLGFVTGEENGDIIRREGDVTPGAAGAAMGAAPQTSLVRVFVPTTPNPTSGFLVIVPANQVTRTKITVQEGMKAVVSGGVLWPPGLSAPPASQANGPVDGPGDRQESGGTNGGRLPATNRIARLARMMKTLW